MSLSKIISSGVRDALKAEVARLNRVLDAQRTDRDNAKRNADYWDRQMAGTQAELESAQAYLAKVEAEA